MAAAIELADERRAGRGVDGERRRALRLHDDVALPARLGQGRAACGGCSTRRSGTRAAVRDPATGAPGWRRWARAMLACSTATRGASTSRSPACSATARAALVARPRARGAGGHRARRGRRRPRSSCWSTATSFWAARLALPGPGRLEAPRSSRPGSTSTTFPSLPARGRGRRLRGRDAPHDEDFAYGLAARARRRRGPDSAIEPAAGAAELAAHLLEVVARVLGRDQLRAGVDVFLTCLSRASASACSTPTLAIP